MNDVDLKPLFRSLLRKYHPDVTIDLKEKEAFGELTRTILVAYENGDGDTLREIERLGLAYCTPPSEEASEPVEMPEWEEEKPPRRSSSWRRNLRVFAPLWFPYGLAFVIKTWNVNGKRTNAVCIAGGLFWGWLGIRLWGWVGALGHWLEANGYPHESLVGLGIVLLRGVVLLVLLPIVVPLGMVALRAGWLLASAWVANWVLSGILGYIHPYLAWVATFGIGAAVSVALWRSLDEW